MPFDPIVEEVHNVRAKLFEECGRDLSVYMTRLKDREMEHRHRLVSTVEKTERPALAHPGDLAR